MEFKFIPSVSSYPMFVDKGKLDKIVYNLLSNAFKYTPEGGKIVCSVDVEEETKKLIISVSDTYWYSFGETRATFFSIYAK